MTDCISRTAAIETVVKKPDMTPGEKAGIIARLLAVPAADVVERKHGKQIDDGCITKCSACGETRLFPHWNFCPACGDDMREVQHD